MLSVVIPVYNVSATLDRCLESVVCQLPAGAEVIIVDDGSSDGSGVICDRWADSNECIRVVHQTNGGLSAARNAGISLARHPFITFVDSDDYVGQGVYTKIMALMTSNPNIDMVEYGIVKHLADGTTQTLAFDDHVYDNSVEYWLQLEAYNHTYAWNKVYKRSLFDTVRYPEGKHFEDMCVMPQLIGMMQQVATISDVCYHYVVNPNGISCNATAADYATLLEAHWQMWQGIDIPAHSKANYYMAMVNIQIMLCCMKWQKPLISTYRLWPCGLKGMAKIKSVMVSLMGIRLTCGIFVLLKKLISFARNAFFIIFA